MRQRRGWGRFVLPVLILTGCALLCATGAEAQQVASVKVVNRAPVQRTDIETVVIPFAQGTYTGGPLSVNGTDTLGFEPMGARWPDGSIRMVRAQLQTTLKPNETRSYAITKGMPTSPVRFKFGGSVLANWNRFADSLRLHVGEKTTGFRTWEWVGGNELEFALRFRERVQGTPVWCELTLEIGRNLGHVDFVLRYGTSDLSDPAIQWTIGPVKFSAGGVHTHILHAPGKELGRTVSGDVTTLALDPGGKWGMGESQAIRGVFIFGGDPASAYAETLIPVLSVAENWQASGAYGLTGNLPTLPSTITATSLSSRAVRDYNTHQNQAPWGAPVLSLVPNNHTTGTFNDIIGIPCVAEAWGHVDRLFAIDRSILQEACRPTHLRLADASPYRFADPTLNMWEDQLFFTGNKLGKNFSWSPGATHTGGGQTWLGRWPEKDLANYLAAYAMLTGDRFALDELEHIADLRTQTTRTNTGNVTIDSMGAARQVGFQLQVCSWLYLLTGRDDMRQAIERRVDRAVQQWNGKRSGIQRPLVVIGPDPRWLGGTVSFWMPWQETIAAEGLLKTYALTGYEPARDLAYEVMKSALLYGMSNALGPWGVYGAVEWRNGTDDGQKAWPTSSPTVPDPTLFNVWAIVPTLWIVDEAKIRGDTAVLNRAKAFIAQEAKSKGTIERVEWLGAVESKELPGVLQ